MEWKNIVPIISFPPIDSLQRSRSTTVFVRKIKTIKGSVIPEKSAIVKVVLFRTLQQLPNNENNVFSF